MLGNHSQVFFGISQEKEGLETLINLAIGLRFAKGKGKGDPIITVLTM